MNRLGGATNRSACGPKIGSHLSGAPLALALLATATAHAQTVPAQTEILSEIIVTANKRVERIQDVPISMTALTEEALQKQGAESMADYLLAQPSVVVQERGPARNQIVMRGIATTVAFENPTVAFYLDEVPVSKGLGAIANGFPDLKTFDLNRVEVLRGPQGTLYGAGSMGGTVKLVPNSPQLGVTTVSGELSASDLGDGGNYNAAAALNLPLNDTVAWRIAGYGYREGGFVDNVFGGSPDPTQPVAALGGLSWADVGVSSFGLPARTDRDANTVDTAGVRTYLLFAPNEDFRIRFGALYQDQKADGLPEAVPSVGRFAQNRFMQEKLQDEFQLYDVLINYQLGSAALTSSTSYMIREQNQSRDVSAFFLTSPIALVDDNDTNTFVQELRLSSREDTPLQWIVGAYYAHATSDALQDANWSGTDQSLVEFTSLLTALGAVPAPVLPGGVLFLRDDDNEARQVAGFGDLSYAFTSQFTASLGARLSSYKVSSDAFADGALNGGATSADLSGDETVLTPKFQLEYKPNDDHLHYARIAQGFRPGGPNQAVPGTCDADLAALGLSEVPDNLDSDQLWSYEIGSKNSFAGGRGTLNAAVFYIDWTDIQTGFLLPNCGFSFASNAGKARSQGVELDFAAQITDALVFSAQGSYTDAELREDSPPGSGIGGSKGDRLPGVPEWTVSASLEYGFSIGERDGFLRGDFRYLSDYLNRFPGDIRGLVLPSGDYEIVDLRAGFAVSSSLRLEIFAQNVFDTRPSILVDTELPDGREVIGRPRTIGAMLRFSY
jgi:iron complex outermembrane recepter protein